jgi:DNA-binding SARP family transcriptional activator
VFELQLLGWWSLTSDAHPVELGRREQRLTALVALRGPRARPHLAGTLWPDTTEERARASLRTALLRTQARAPGVLQVSRSTVGLGQDVHVDVQDLLHVAHDLDDPSGPVDGIGPVLDGDELLPGWYDDWVIYERERLQQIRLRALELAARRALRDGDPATALRAAREAVVIEPLDEQPHAVIIRAHLMDGNPSGALRAFHDFRRQLAAELGIGPSPGIVDLLRPLLERQSGPPRPPRQRA